MVPPALAGPTQFCELNNMGAFALFTLINMLFTLHDFNGMIIQIYKVIAGHI